MRDMTHISLEQILLEWPVSKPISGSQLQQILPSLSEDIASSADVQPGQLVILFCEENGLQPTHAEWALLDRLSTLIRALSSYLAGELTARVMVDLFRRYFRFVETLAPKAGVPISTYLEAIFMDTDRYPDLEEEKRESGFVDDKFLNELMTEARTHYVKGWKKTLANIEERTE